MSKTPSGSSIASIVLIVVAVAAWLRQPRIGELSGSTAIASPEQLLDAVARGAVIVDVRTAAETGKEGALLVPGAVQIPLQSLPQELAGLPRDRPIVTYCAVGGRAGQAAHLLRERGFEALNGGGVGDLRALVEARTPAGAAGAPPNAGH